jgi:hypothetical protein
LLCFWLQNNRIQRLLGFLGNISLDLSVENIHLHQEFNNRYLPGSLRF